MADAEAPASKKRAREEEAVPAPYKGSDDEDDEEYNPMPAKWAKKDVTTAMLWSRRRAGLTKRNRALSRRGRRRGSAGDANGPRTVSPLTAYSSDASSDRRPRRRRDAS